MDFEMSRITKDEIEAFRQSGQFDEKWYLEQYPDVRSLGLDAAEHYLWIGKRLGRLPSPSLRMATRTTNIGEAKLPQNIYQNNEIPFEESILSIYDINRKYIDDIKFSIIMPAYNRENLIKKAIDSVLFQSHKNYELIIIDDGSTDRTREIILSISDERIKLITGDHKGVSAARNKGLIAATGEIISYLDSDNTWRPNYLRNMATFMLSSNLECAYAELKVIDSAGNLIMKRGQPFDWDLCLRGNYVDLNVYCHSRSLLSDIGLFDEKLRRTVDWDLILRQTKNRKVGYAAFVGCDYLHDLGDGDRVTVKQPILFLKVVQIKNGGTFIREPEEISEEISINFAIKIPAPRAKKEEWGDYHFASSLAEALSEKGHRVRIDFLDEWYDSRKERDEVIISLRGLTRYKPSPGPINILWNISHPDQILFDEYNSYDIVYTSSESYASFLKFFIQKDIKPLLQATDPKRFNVKLSRNPAKASRVIFVGNSRNEYRQIVRWAREADVPLDVYGTRWSQYIPSEMIKGENIDNRELGSMYGGSEAVLNDHWESMKDFGILSNRIFDAAATGTNVISDYVPAIKSIFGNLIHTVNSSDELARAVKTLDKGSTGARAELVEAEHTFAHRADVIVNDILAFLSLPPKSGALPLPGLIRKKRIRASAFVKWGASHPQSSAYIRLHSPLTTDEAFQEVDLKIYPADRFEDCDLGDVTIVQRVAIDQMDKAKRLVDNIAKREGKLIVDLDDAFNLIDDTHPEYAKYKSVGEALSFLVGAADKAWFSTKKLMDAYAAQTLRGEVIPNGLDPRLWRNYRTPRPKAGTRPKLNLVYMGTATHEADFQMILPALLRAQEIRQGAFDLTLIGAVKEVPQEPWIKRINPPADSTSYPKFVRWWLNHTHADIGLAPLVVNPFNQCKSDIKFLDYAAFGVLPLLSNCEPYKDAGSEGRALLIPNDIDSWANAIVEALDTIADRHSGIEAAAKYLWRERSAMSVANMQLDSLRGVV